MASIRELFYLLCVESLQRYQIFCSVFIKRVIISMQENGSTKQRSFQSQVKTYGFIFLLFLLIVFGNELLIIALN